ncbi:hypothetical protein Tco_0762172 [Tanacetum coccineum]
MYVDLDMLRALMLHWIRREIRRLTHIVTIGQVSAWLEVNRCFSGPGWSGLRGGLGGAAVDVVVVVGSGDAEMRDSKGKPKKAVDPQGRCCLKKASVRKSLRVLRYVGRRDWIKVTRAVTSEENCVWQEALVDVLDVVEAVDGIGGDNIVIIPWSSQGRLRSVDYEWNQSWRSWVLMVSNGVPGGLLRRCWVGMLDSSFSEALETGLRKDP